MLRSALLGTALAASAPALALPAFGNDDYLEQVTGPAALATVRRWNAATDAVLTKQPGFEKYRARALALLEDDARIAEPDQIVGDQVLNLWRDAKNPRGLWRIAPLASFAGGKPAWRVLIDVDALGKREQKSWVWEGATCRAPDYTRCMVALADGGTDAHVEREFDLPKGAFVPGGFTLPAAKSDLAWGGPDTLYVSTDYGANTLTSSGYPRIVKRWQRGTPLAQAETVAEGIVTDVSVSAQTIDDGATQWTLIRRGLDFYHQIVSHVLPDGRLERSPLPLDAEVQDIIGGRVIAQLQSRWRGYPAGALIAYSIADILAKRTSAIETVLVPSPTQAIEQVAAGKDVLWVKLLDDVSGKVLTLRRAPSGKWSWTAIALPGKSTIDLNAVAGRTELAFATVEGMLTPPTLYALRPGTLPQQVQALPARFDTSKMSVEQRFARSPDGTRVPYFLVRKAGVDKPVPVLIHAYGGFRAAQTPTYLVDQPYRSGPAALFWVEEGNAYVLANIRGGGEYGPAWHDAALREKRQNAFDDFHAVAEDLVLTGVTTAGRIAPSGRSNGGLLVGVLMEQRPDLYGAVVMGSPLTDMRNYAHLLAGASWMGEYGDPARPEDWAFIAKYSPLQNLQPHVPYPVPFIYTSTKDDRVHPVHARKFAAKLGELGDKFYYHEAIEGGHAAGADRREDALRAALVTVYLNKQLGVTKAR